MKIHLAVECCVPVLLLSLLTPVPDTAAQTIGCGLEAWSMRTALASVWLRDIAASPEGRFVSVGDSGVLMTSNDGAVWDLHLQAASIGFARVRYVGGRYFAMGRQFGAIPTTWSSVLWTSPDGAGWTPRYDAANTVINGIAYGNGVFIAVAIVTDPGGPNSAHALTSTDGAQWTDQGTMADWWIYDITFGNGVFVATGVGQILASEDGVSWIPASILVGQAFHSVTFFQNQFIAVGTGGNILTSADGLQWTPRNSGTTAFLAAIASGAGQVAAVGGDGTVVTSPNGVDWTLRSGFRRDLRGIAYGTESFVAVGRYGAVYQSDPIATCNGPHLTIIPGSPVRLDLSGTIGARHLIEYSDQLGGPWLQLQEVAVLTESPYGVFDAAPSPTGRRFYRAVQMP